MNNPNIAVSMRKRRQETIARNKRKREQRNKELRRDQFDKIIKEEKQRIIEANTIDLTADDDILVSKQLKMTDFLKKVPFT